MKMESSGKVRYCGECRSFYETFEIGVDRIQCPTVKDGGHRAEYNPELNPTLEALNLLLTIARNTGREDAL